MDAGARGRRLLQRREYKAKVSEFIPKELEDQFGYDENGQLIFELDLKKVGQKLKTGLKNFINKPIMKDYPTQQQYQKSIQNKTSNQYSSYEPEGEMIEASDAQMKAMHDAKVKKMEDDKVAEKKKKKVDEACWKGYEKKGMKTMFGKRYPNCVKKTKKEEVELEAKKSCGEGEYYCHDDQKCKPIPDGMKVGKDGMLVKEDMKGMSQKSGDKRSTESGAGMTAQGVAKYNRRTGGNLKTAVTTPPSKLKPGSKAAKRRKSFCARSRSWTGPRGKAARRRWNCSYEPELPMIIDEKKKLFNSAPLSDRVAVWSKKISEASPLTPDRNDYGLPTGLKSSTKTTKKTKVNPNKLPVAEADFSLDDLEKSQKKYYDLTIPRERAAYSRLKKAGKNPLIKKVDEQKKLNPKAVFPTVSNVKIKNEIISDSGISNKNSVKKKFPTESKMTPTQKKKKEKYVKGMKKDKGGFTKRYGKDGKSVMYATATKMAMKEVLGGVPGDGYLGHPNLNIKNPFAKKQIKKPVMPGSQGGGLINRTAGKLGDRKMQLDKLMQQLNSFKPEGQMIEAKYEKGASTYGKASIRNKRAYGYGGNAKPPAERGAAITRRKDEHMARRGVKKGNKYAPDKYKPTVHGRDEDNDKYRKNKNVSEGSLHSWFKGSKSKDGKPGWVNVVTGGTCASDKPGEGTPKCVSSSKRASMTKAERLSASRRKKKADPGQQSKSGAAKPTYVATDSKKKK